MTKNKIGLKNITKKIFLKNHLKSKKVGLTTMKLIEAGVMSVNKEKSGRIIMILIKGMKATKLQSQVNIMKRNNF